MNQQDLQHYKATLLDMRSRSRAEIHRMVEIVLDGAKAAGEHDWQVSEAVDKELSLGRTEEMIHAAVIDALQRIEDGTFGRCRKCGSSIPKTRLDAIPFTPYCVHCERRIERLT